LFRAITAGINPIRIANLNTSIRSVSIINNKTKDIIIGGVSWGVRQEYEKLPNLLYISNYFDGDAGGFGSAIAKASKKKTSQFKESGTKLDSEG